MQPKVIITCAVTGAGDTVGKSPQCARHARANRQLRAGSRKRWRHRGALPCAQPGNRQGLPPVCDYYREVMERIRAKNTNVIINLTAGMGGDVVVGDGETPLKFGEGTDCVGPLERLIHVKELRPEICTLDCGTLNFGDGQSIVVQTPTQLRQQAALIKSYGVKPEMEIFDSGNLWFANQLVKEGLIDGPPLYQLCLGIPWGAPYNTETMAYQKIATAGRCGLGLLRHWPQSDSRSGTGRASRRPRPRRP